MFNYKKNPHGKIAIIMYHFVRDLKHSRYPKIKGLTIKAFKEQLSFLEDNYNFISIEDCIEAIYNNRKLPPNSALLTFDDGYIDHYVTVFPILGEKNIQGCFFPPAKAIQNNKVLDVNKIHFVLAAAPRIEDILKDIKLCLEGLKAEYKLYDFDYYFKKLAKKGRFDPKEIIFIKRLLQKELNLKARGTIVDRLFKKYVSEDEEAFSKELYMGADHLKCMIKNGMYIGGHGHDHFWLDTLEEKDQIKEVEQTIKFLGSINAPVDNWVMNYPYGAYNDALVRVLKKK